MELKREQVEQLEERLREIPGQLERLHQSGQKQLSRTDPDSRFLRERGRHVLGYTAEVAVSADHLIVAQRVTQQASDNGSLAAMVEQLERHCGQRPQKVSADARYFSLEQVKQLAKQQVEVYLPDPHLAYELNTGRRVRGIGNHPVRDPMLQQMRRKWRSPAGRATYQQRKTLVEPLLGTLKEQRGMRRFRRRACRASTVCEIGVICGLVLSWDLQISFPGRGGVRFRWTPATGHPADRPGG